MAGQNYLPRHTERIYEQSRINPIPEHHLRFGHNAVPPRSDSRVDAFPLPPPVPYPTLYTRNNHQPSVAPITHPNIMLRSSRDHASSSSSSSSSFNPHIEYPNYHPTMMHPNNHTEAGPSYAPPPHAPHDAADNNGRITLKRKHHDVPVPPTNTQIYGNNDITEESQRNVRIRQGYYCPLEINPPRQHYASSNVTPIHYSVPSNSLGMRAPEHANYSVHVSSQDRNIQDPSRFNHDLNNGHHHHTGNHISIARHEPNHYYAHHSRSYTLPPPSSHQNHHPIARSSRYHVGTTTTTSIPHMIPEQHQCPAPNYASAAATSSSSVRWRQGYNEYEAFNSHPIPIPIPRPIVISDSGMNSARPRNHHHHSGLRNPYNVDHHANRWLFEHFVSGEEHLVFDPRELFDEHRDMRLDIDDMSYEELLALEESIGYVNTGLPDDRISKCLKETTYHTSNESQDDSCVICMEEYEKGEKMGTLRCAHHFHTSCIRNWLQVKNTCPVCKSEALEDVSLQKMKV